MNKSFYIIIVILIQHLASKAQVNLVANPSFEDTVHCPNSNGQMMLPSACKNWYDPNNSSADYFNSCAPNYCGVPNNFAGWQYARTGVAYPGMLFYENLNGREYIQEKLDSILLSNHKYCIEFYISLANKVNIACNNVGMYISDTIPPPPNIGTPYINCIPQVNDTTKITDTLGWTKVSGTYLAHGGEQYITIGNFYDNTHTDTTWIAHYINAALAYYYVDDVSIVDCTPGLRVSELGISNDELRIVPNPTNGEFSINLNKECKNVNVEITDVIGQLVYETTAKETKQINLTLNQPPGLYFVTVITDERKQVLKLVKE